MQEWEIMIDKITERKELTKTLRKHGFNATADEYLEMVGALKLYFLQQIDKAREETAREIIEWIEEEGTVEYLNHGEPCEVYEVTPNDIQQLKEKYKGVGYGNSIV